MLDSILQAIRKLEESIESKVKNIKKLENDYDDLLDLRKKLNSAAERHERICQRKRSALNDPVLESSRCMQMFRQNMEGMLDSGKVHGLSDRISGAAGSLGSKMSSLLEEIGGEETAMEKLKDELEEWRTKLSALSGKDQ